MDSYYAIIFGDLSLKHHGILGQKWGVRRYQNPDGTLTSAGRRRYVDSKGRLTKEGETLRNNYVNSKTSNNDNYARLRKTYSKDNTTLCNFENAFDGESYTYENGSKFPANTKGLNSSDYIKSLSRQEQKALKEAAKNVLDMNKEMSQIASDFITEALEKPSYDGKKFSELSKKEQKDEWKNLTTGSNVTSYIERAIQDADNSYLVGDTGFAEEILKTI